LTIKIYFNRKNNLYPDNRTGKNCRPKSKYRLIEKLLDLYLTISYSLKKIMFLSSTFYLKFPFFFENIMGKDIIG